MLHLGHVACRHAGAHAARLIIGSLQGTEKDKHRLGGKGMCAEVQRMHLNAAIQTTVMPHALAHPASGAPGCWRLWPAALQAGPGAARHVPGPPRRGPSAMLRGCSFTGQGMGRRP